MTITGVAPNPVPAGQPVTITFTPGTATNVAVTLNGRAVAVNWQASGAGSVTITQLPGPGNYQVTITNDANDSDTTPVLGM